MIKFFPIFLWAFFCLVACEQPTKTDIEEVASNNKIDSIPLVDPDTVILDSIKTIVDTKGLNVEQIDSILTLPDSAWVDLSLLLPDLVVDIRYATTNNFMKTKIYDCGECYTRLAVAKAVMKIQAELKEQELGLKMFDCYRPRSAQYKLWEVVPDPRYVSPPGKGSVHSRGGALDLTIVNKDLEELDMGTAYDFFGKEAYWAHIEKQPEIVQENRKLLLSIMKKHGFKTVSTEWWHYSYRRAWFKLSDMQWACD